MYRGYCVRLKKIIILDNNGRTETRQNLRTIIMRKNQITVNPCALLLYRSYAGDNTKGKILWAFVMHVIRLPGNARN